MTVPKTPLPHPRLYIGRKQLARLRRPAKLPLLADAQRQLAEAAERFAGCPRIEWTPDTHNGHLIRARRMQDRVLTLLARWKQTDDPRFRDAALAYVLQMGRWKHWSWIAWRAGDARPEAIFDLSYGENSATLAVAYDLLHDELTGPQRAELVAIGRDRALRPFLHNTTKGNLSWWFGKPDTNWNTVCAGGAGMLALALLDELAEARQALPRVERSIEPFMQLPATTDGAWPEGIGYWNYGFRYAIMYLLSWGRSFGRPHRLLVQPATRKTLEFPLDFCPNGVPASFGDVNRFFPLPFHYAAAEQLGMAGLIARMDALPHGSQKPGSSWPDAAELLLLHPRTTGGRAGRQRNVVKLYRGLDWGILADRMPDPTMYLSVRGGTTEVPHGHLDLLSFHCVVGDEAMVPSIGPAEYLDTTFSPRRWELPEMNPAGKNTILINGVGIAARSRVQTRRLRAAGLDGLRMDATAAMGVSRGDLPAAAFCGRLFLMLPGVGFLIVDRVEQPFAGRVESRLHTFADVQVVGRGAKLTGRRQRLRIAYAADVPAAVFTAQMAPTTPAEGARVLRWCTTDRLQHAVTMATLLAPGAAAAKVAVAHEGRGLAVHVSRGGRSRRIHLTARLRPAAT